MYSHKAYQRRCSMYFYVLYELHLHQLKHGHSTVDTAVT